MSLEIQQREREGITVLEMKGRITVGKEATALREKIAELIAGRHAQPRAQPGGRRLHR